MFISIDGLLVFIGKFRGKFNFSVKKLLIKSIMFFTYELRMLQFDNQFLKIINFSPKFIVIDQIYFYIHVSKNI